MKYGSCKANKIGEGANTEVIIMKAWYGARRLKSSETNNYIDWGIIILQKKDDYLVAFSWYIFEIE